MLKFWNRRRTERRRRLREALLNHINQRPPTQALNQTGGEQEILNLLEVMAGTEQITLKVRGSQPGSCVIHAIRWNEVRRLQLKRNQLNIVTTAGAVTLL